MTGTRGRIVDATAVLLRRNGYTATGLKQIASASGAPIGSMYHFFPGGKDELTAESLRTAGEGYQRLVESVFDAAPDVVTGLRNCFDTAAQVLEATDYADACPIETVALEVASTNEPLRVVTAEIFERWAEAATDRMRAAGATPKQARSLALGFLCALEGAFVLARAHKSPEPLAAARDVMVTAVRDALDHRRTGKRRR